MKRKPTKFDGGFTEDRGPIPIRGGPHDGAMHCYTIILPFCGGGLASTKMLLCGHWYDLAPDHSHWKYSGKDALKGKR